MKAATVQFKERAALALRDAPLQKALGKLTNEGFVAKRAKAVQLGAHGPRGVHIILVEA